MFAINENEVRELIHHGQEPSLSMYIAMQPPTGDTKQNPVQFRNALKCMQEELGERGYNGRQIQELLAPSFELLENGAFWQNQKSTLAYFVSPSGQRYWQLDATLTPQLYVDALFHIRPLLPLTQNHRRYYLLALSQKSVRLWLGDPNGVQEIELPKLAGGIDVALNLDTQEGLMQFHSAQPSLRSKEGAAFHGQGGAPDTHKEELLAYCRIVDREVTSKISEKLPLFVATVGYLFPIYQRANSFPDLVAEPIEGNPDQAPVAEIHAEATRRVLANHQSWRTDRERFAAQTGSGRTSDFLMDIVPAAERGQVEAIFVLEQEHRWGHLDSDSGRVYLDPEGMTGASDLFESAVAAVLRRGGRVHVLSQNEMPSKEPIAALYRYPLPAGQPV